MLYKQNLNNIQTHPYPSTPFPPITCTKCHSRVNEVLFSECQPSLPRETLIVLWDNTGETPTVQLDAFTPLAVLKT